MVPITRLPHNTYTTNCETRTNIEEPPRIALFACLYPERMFV
jgi:cell division protein YceG involved in septum cleavage